MYVDFITLVGTHNKVSIRGKFDIEQHPCKKNTVKFIANVNMEVTNMINWCDWICLCANEA